jgi:hypothetical protein
MTDLHRQANETAAEWLARLKGIPAPTLTGHGPKVLALSLGYARYLAAREGAATNGPAARSRPNDQ